MKSVAPGKEALATTPVQVPARFPEKVAIVTGAASGIGRATARAFAAAGARVVAADVDESGCHATLEGEAVDRTAVVRCDVSVDADVRGLVEETMARFGRIDCFHNNAGISELSAQLHELDGYDWDRVMAINLRGAWLCLRYVLPTMYSRRQGAIVNSASVAGDFGFAGLGAYCASKAGVLALTRVAAIEAAPHGVRVNAIAPGMIDTPLASSGVDDPAARGGPSPSRRLGRPEEVADTVLWLCSEQSSYLNGAAIPIDGGWSATLGARRPNRRGTQTLDGFPTELDP